MDCQGACETIIEHVPAQPSGLGFGVGGELLIVSMKDKRLLKLSDEGRIEQVSDLRAVSAHWCNDMVVDRRGRAYIGNFGFDLYNNQQDETYPPGPQQPQAACVVLVPTDPADPQYGKPTVAASDLWFPNGIVISSDEKTLIVAETMAHKLTAFDVDETTGSVSNRRTWAKVESYPDGICLDAEGCVWVAACHEHAAIRVQEGGAILQRIVLETFQCYALMLGGPNGNTLFTLEALSHDPRRSSEDPKHGRIRSVHVSVPHAGWP